MEIIDTFDKQLHGGSVRKAMDATNAGRRDQWLMRPDDIHVMDGFNVRVKDAKYLARVRRYADSMKSEGFYPHKPLAIYIAKEDGGDIAYVYDGHTRLDAVKLAISEGAEIEMIPVVPQQAGTSVEDLTVALIQGNDGERLSVFETAVVCKRLVRYGVPEDEIAKRLSYTKEYVMSLLGLMSAPVELRQFVLEGKMSATVAMEIIEKHGERATDKAKDAVAKAESEGKPRATARHASPESAMSKRAKKYADEMLVAISSVKSDPAYDTLDSPVKVKIEALLDILSKE